MTERPPMASTDPETVQILEMKTRTDEEPSNVNANANQITNIEKTPTHKSRKENSKEQPCEKWGYLRQSPTKGGTSGN